MNAMKTYRVSRLAALAALPLLLPLTTATSRAASNPSNPSALSVDSAVPQDAQFQRVDWDDAKRHKLRRAYWLLEFTKDDYGGHKLKAIEEMKKAGHDMGIDLHGESFPAEGQRASDERLREAKHLLEDIVDPGHHREHEHIWNAIQHLDKALRRA
jgi:hypothetical protein